MSEESVNIAEAKRHFSELIGQVAYGKKRLLITKRGKPMARLVPVEEAVDRLSDARGWLEENDMFFKTIEGIVTDRKKTNSQNDARPGTAVMYLLDTNILSELIKRRPAPHLIE